jgi:NAD(P)-dependent dehydrogenase (short-subunit alcohol dehydrogenase family)
MMLSIRQVVQTPGSPTRLSIRDLSIDRTLRGQVAGKVVLTTGDSSGIVLADAAELLRRVAFDHGLAADNERKEARACHQYFLSIGVLTNAPGYCAYVASKVGLDAWNRCAASDFADLNIKFAIINMPLMCTPMIESTKIYQNVSM